jgi:lambda repressor-like predicted transcriptional regulator
LKVDKRKLEIAMARAKLNKYDLAAKAGMPIPTVGNVYTRGTCKPATVGRIAEALGIDVTEILADE